MNLTIEEIIKIWREEKQKEEELLKSAPREHPQKTPDCLSFFRFKDFVEGAIELTPEENLHIQNCSYCPKVLAMFQKKFKLKPEGEIENQRVIRMAAEDRLPTQEKIAVILEKIGDRLAQAIIPITEEVHGELAIESETSLWLILKKKDKTAHDFDGCEMAFFLVDRKEKVTDIIEDGVALIDFGKLNIPIEDYGKVRFRIRIAEKIIEAEIREG